MTGFGRGADMTTEQLDAILSMSSNSSRYVAPVCDTQLGRDLFDSGYGRRHCRTALQAAGWDERQREARHSYLCMCLAADMEQIAGAR